MRKKSGLSSSFLGLPLLQNRTETLATKAAIVDKPFRHLIFFDNCREERNRYLYLWKAFFHSIVTSFEALFKLLWMRFFLFR